MEWMPEHIPEWSPELARSKDAILGLITIRTRSSPVSSDYLGNQCELEWEQVWAIVERLWDEKHPVCTVGSGFWYAQDGEDLADTQEYLRQQAHLFIVEGQALKQTGQRLRAERDN